MVKVVGCGRVVGGAGAEHACLVVFRKFGETQKSHGTLPAGVWQLSRQLFSVHRPVFFVVFVVRSHRCRTCATTRNTNINIAIDLVAGYRTRRVFNKAFSNFIARLWWHLTAPNLNGRDCAVRLTQICIPNRAMLVGRVLVCRDGTVVFILFLGWVGGLVTK